MLNSANSNANHSDAGNKRTHPHPITPQYFLSEMASPSDITVAVSRQDFELALRELTPSVSQAEMEHYARIQSRFSRKPSDNKKSKGKGKARAMFEGDNEV